MVTSQIINQNVVIVSDGINTASFSQFWFIQNGVFKQDEILPDSIFAPGLTNLSAIDCNILIVPNQIQFTIKSDDILLAKECITKRLLPIVQTISTMHLKAMGLNFTWRINAQENIPIFSKRIFCNQASSLSSVFNDDNARFGTYMSKDFKGTRLKLDIKPVIINENGRANEFILAAFNFHRDISVSTNELDSIISILNNWDIYGCESKEITKLCQ